MSIKGKIVSSIWLEDYIKQYTKTPIDVDSSVFQPVKNFPLIWNIYEYRFFGKRCSEKKVWDADYLCPEEEVTTRAFTFFKNRYVSDGIINERFQYLNLGSSHKNDIKTILCADNPTIKAKNKVCRMIILRYRNNLFHGEKEICRLGVQLPLFAISDEYLMSLIDNVLKKQ